MRRHLAGALLLGFLATASATAEPLYRAGQPSSKTVSSLLHGEVSAGYVMDSLKLQDYMEESSSSALRGVNGRALWSPLPWLALGAEYTRFFQTDLMSSFVDAYRVNRLGGIVKLTLAPNTLPRLYLLAGYGRSEHKLNFARLPGMQRSPIHKDIPYWTLGLGIETDIWKCVFAGVEGNIVWNKDRKLGPYHQTVSKVDTALQLRMGVRF